MLLTWHTIQAGLAVIEHTVEANGLGRAMAGKRCGTGSARYAAFIIPHNEASSLALWRS